MKITQYQNYSLSTPALFAVIGLGLLLVVIFCHNYINNLDQWWSQQSSITTAEAYEVNPSTRPKFSLNSQGRAGQAGQTGTNPLPATVLNEVIRSDKNISTYPTAEVINSSFSIRKLYEMSHPTVFITQE